MPKQTYTTGQLIRRSVTPSPSSTFICAVVSMLIVMSGVILSSVRYGTALPSVFDGEWAIFYTEHVVQPLTTFFSNASFNKSFVAVIWGVIGLVAYIGFEYGTRTYRSYKQARHDVAVQQGQVLMHATQQEANRAILWRIGVAVGFIIFFLIMQPLLRNAGSVVPRFIVSQEIGKDALRLLLAVAEWWLFWHGVVVAMRLYVMRTRIFGDDRLY